MSAAGRLSLVVVLACAGCEDPDGAATGPDATAPDAGDVEAEEPLAPADEWADETREVPEIPETWRALGVTEELIAPWLARDTAPDTFRVRLDTTEGEVVVECVREWAPRGADRFYNLVKVGYFTDVAFYRVLEGRLAQFGLHGNPVVGEAWIDATIGDDPVLQSNRRGYLSFGARRRANSRSCILFFNLADNPEYDAEGYAPIGRVTSGLSALDRIDSSQQGIVPDHLVRRMGNAYLRQSHPSLDYVRSAELVE